MRSFPSLLNLGFSYGLLGQESVLYIKVTCTTALHLTYVHLFFIRLRLRAFFFSKLVDLQAHACDFIQDPAVLLVCVRIKVVDDLVNVGRCKVHVVLLVRQQHSPFSVSAGGFGIFAAAALPLGLFKLAVGDDKAVAIVDSFALP